jgi:hypothetical protein
MLPYDGSPGGNALGMQFDEERRRFHDSMVEASLEATDEPRTWIQLAVFVLGASVVLFVMLYGTIS